MNPHSFLMNALVFLGAAVVAVPASKRLGLGTLLGYLVAGSLLGPWGFKLIQDVETIMRFAELGVVLMLFIIGLELKPIRLWQLRKSVFGLGTVQLVGTAAVVAAAASFLGARPTGAAIIGIGLSLSSTAFAVQLLSERNQLNTQFGQVSFSILLFQDLAVIPLLAVLPLLSEAGASSPASLGSLGVVVGIAVGGRFLLRPLFRAIAWTQTKELFTAASLLLVLGIAATMEAVGLSMGLGAFIAGVLLADSEYRHELEADIEPFKGLLLGLFFMSVGMSVDYGLLTTKPQLVLPAVAALLLIKAAILLGIGKIADLGECASRSMAATLSQGGEFAFVLFGIAAAQGLLPRETADLLVLIVALSMALSPLVVKLNERYLDELCGDTPPNYDAIQSEDNPVLIAGFGRVGQIPARLLRVKNVGFTALEHDSEHVATVRKFGQKIYYGDASRLDLLEAAGAKRAKIFILAIDDVEASLRTAAVVKQHFPHLKIIARARNRTHHHQLRDLGLTSIFRETFASSLEMTGAVLNELGVSKSEIADSLARFREHDEKTLFAQNAVHKNEQDLINVSKKYSEQLLELFRQDKS